MAGCLVSAWGAARTGEMGWGPGFQNPSLGRGRVRARAPATVQLQGPASGWVLPPPQVMPSQEAGGRRPGVWHRSWASPIPSVPSAQGGRGVVLARPAHPVSPTGAQADGGFIPGAQGACLQSPAGLCLWSVCGAAPNSGLKPETWTGQGRGCQQTLRVPATPRPQYSWRWGLWLIPRPTWANAEDPNEDPLAGDSVPCPQPCPGSHTFLCGPGRCLEPQMATGPAFSTSFPGPAAHSPPPLPSTQALPTINSFFKIASKHKSMLDRAVGKASSRLAPKSHVVRPGLFASPRPPSAPTAGPGAGPSEGGPGGPAVRHPFFASCCSPQPLFSGPTPTHRYPSA